MKYLVYFIQKDGSYDRPTEAESIEELATLICSNQDDKIVTDVYDNLVFNTFGMFIDRFSDEYKHLRSEILAVLIPKQEELYEDL